MTRTEINTITKLCQKVSKNKVENEDGEMTSVAFGGNCGNFALGLLFFLADIDFPFDEWEVGFLFNNIHSLSEIYSDNEADLNHVVLILDGVPFDGDGKVNISDWYGKLFKIDNLDKIENIIENFTIPSISVNELQPLFKRAWKTIE